MSTTEVMAVPTSAPKTATKIDIRSTIIIGMVTFALGYHTAAGQPPASATTQPATAPAAVSK